MLLDADSRCVVEDPGYLMARRSFAATGARLLPIPVDAAGMVTAQLPQGEAVRLACVTPSHQFPLGGILPVERRRELLAWARASGAWVVEDDYDGEFRYGQRPIDALQAFDTEGRVLYIGTFSKVLSPQLRLGYLVLPVPLVPVFRRAKQLTDRHAPVLEQRVLATLLDSGAYERHVRRTRRGHERRRLALLSALERELPVQVQVVGAAAGLHVVLRLPGLAPADEGRIVRQAEVQGLGVYPLSPLYVDPDATATPGRAGGAGLILGYASLTEAQIARGVQGLGAVVRSVMAARQGAAMDTATEE